MTIPRHKFPKEVASNLNNLFKYFMFIPAYSTEFLFIIDVLRKTTGNNESI